MPLFNSPRFRKLVSPTLITGLLASALVMLPVAPATAQDAACDFGVGRGDGSPADPYQVASATDLAMVRDCHASAADLYFEQTANISLGSVANWVPIGTVAQPFDDSYDGKFFEIDGLNINATASSSLTHFGLFGKITTTSGTPTVRSIHLTDVDIDVDASGQKVFVGGVIGESDRTTLNGRFRVQGDITVTGTAAADSAVGGLHGDFTVGFTGTDYLFPSRFDGSVSSTADFTGGIAGSLRKTTSGSSTDLRLGSVSGTIEGSKHTGIVAGLVQNETNANLEFTAWYWAASANSLDESLDDGRILGSKSAATGTSGNTGGIRAYSNVYVTDAVGTLDNSVFTTWSASNVAITAAEEQDFVWIGEFNYAPIQDFNPSNVALIRCSELNGGKVIQAAFFIDKFTASGGGPCDLPNSTSAVVSGTQTSVAVDLQAPTGYYVIDNSVATIASDPSGLFSAGSVVGGELTLSASQAVPAGKSPITVSLARPDLNLFDSATVNISILACTFQGDGTNADPFMVETKEQLAAIADCSQGPTTHFELANDLELDPELSSNWDPIGSGSAQFMGVFDGGGHTISGLRIDGGLHNKPLGLFSAASEARIQNLVMTNALVSQDQANRHPSGILLGDVSDHQLEVHNVQISDSELRGSSKLGILIGDPEEDAVSISKVAITRSKISNSDDSFNNVSNVGLLGGKFSEMSVITDTHVSDSTIEISTSGFVQYLAGFMVGCDEDMLIRDSSATGVTISIVAGIDVTDVAGFVAGASRIKETCVLIDSSADTEIDISSNGSIDSVGGFANDADEAMFLRVSSTSTITLEADFEISNVGGFIGMTDNGDLASFSKVESHSTIKILSRDTIEPFAVSSIGLLSGRGGAFTVSDVLVEGSIEIEVSEDAKVEDASNFIGRISSSRADRLRSISNVLINAEPISVTDLAQTPVVVALDSRSYLFAGPSRTEEAQLLFTSTRGVFWNSTSDPGYASDEYGTAASAADINSQAFLTAGGFNFNRDWCMIDGKPRVEAVNPGCLSPASAGGTSFGGGAGSASFQGPVVTSAPAQATAGQTITLVGERLDSVTAASINGIQAQVRVNNDGSLTVTIPEALTTGTFDIELVSSLGSVTIKAAVIVSASAPALASGNGWTKSQSDGTVKVYAKDVVGLGKIQFRQNGKEIAWIRAVDETDPKLRTVTSGPMAGTNYLVRTVTLQPGKNALEIFVDGVRVWRAAYTLR